MYEAIKADIAAHAMGAVHGRVPDDVIVVQRSSAPGPGGAGNGPTPDAAAGGRGGGASHGPAAAASAAPMRVFKGGVHDGALAPRKAPVVKRKYGSGIAQPDRTGDGRRAGAGAGARGSTQGAGRPTAVHVRRANVLAAAMLEEANARLLGAEAELLPPVMDRLADVLTGSVARGPVGSVARGPVGSGAADDAGTAAVPLLRPV